MANPQYAILIDGGFITKKLATRLKHFPTHGDVEAECARIKAHPALAGHDLLRIYFYDAKPATDQISNPISKAITNLATTKVYRENTALQQGLELRSDFAFRAGVAVMHGWTLGKKALAAIAANPRVPTAQDFIPDIKQKGVDLRIGLDIARLSLRQSVRVIVVVTGDSDLVPAFTFARREGVRVYLDYMGHGVKRELRVHTDLVL